MNGTTAVLGASGFIGSRVVEMFHLGGLSDVPPIVRSMASLGATVAVQPGLAIGRHAGPG